MADAPEVKEFARDQAEKVVAEELAEWAAVHVHDSASLRGLAEQVIDGLVDSSHLIPSERWDDECHRCEARIGDHFVDGRCPGPPISDMAGWAQDLNGVWHQVVAAHGPAEHRHPPVALCGHAIVDVGVLVDYRWRPGRDDKWCLMPRCRAEVPA